MKSMDELKQKVCTMAAANGWHHLKTQDWCLNFYKHFDQDRGIINVYWNKRTVDTVTFYKPVFTVQTAINHPKKGKTQLNRKGVTMELLEKIFENPRIHTYGKIDAYFKKK